MNKQIFSSPPSKSEIIAVKLKTIAGLAEEKLGRLMMDFERRHRETPIDRRKRLADNKNFRVLNKYQMEIMSLLYEHGKMTASELERRSLFSNASVRNNLYFLGSTDFVKMVGRVLEQGRKGKLQSVCVYALRFKPKICDETGEIKFQNRSGRK